jgi:protoheme IX farnesyltransferase
VGSAGFTRALTLVRAYGTLLKPKITLLLTAFGLTAALVAAATLGQEVTTGRLVLFALVGLMASGGAACLNHLFDRDIDRTMARTKHRPIPQGVVSPRAAVLYATVLLAVGMPLTFVLLGPVPALFSALGAGIYGGLYTLVLKRRTARNIELGGLAGSCGALAGWAVVDPTLAWGAWVFAALVFLWTPAHFWGLAIARDADYRAVRIPMLPQVAGVEATARMMTLYAALTLAASLALGWVTDLGLVYALAALATGGLYTSLCVGFWRKPSAAAALRVFKSSGAYLGLLIVAMLVDGRF